MPRATQVPPELELVLDVRGYHPLRRLFPKLFHSPFRSSFPPASNRTRGSVRGGWWWRPYNPSRHADWFGLFRFRSPLLAESLRFLFLGLLRCFSSPGSLHTAYGFSDGSPGITLTGFPHSEISGSTLLCSSPERFVAYTSFIGDLSLGIHHAPSVASLSSQLYRVLDALLDQTLCNCQRSLSRAVRSGSPVQRQEEMIPAPLRRVKGCRGKFMNFRVGTPERR